MSGFAGLGGVPLLPPPPYLTETQFVILTNDPKTMESEDESSGLMSSMNAF